MNAFHQFLSPGAPHASISCRLRALNRTPRGPHSHRPRPAAAEPRTAAATGDASAAQPRGALPTLLRARRQRAALLRRGGCPQRRGAAVHAELQRGPPPPACRKAGARGKGELERAPPPLSPSLPLIPVHGAARPRPTAAPAHPRRQGPAAPPAALTGTAPRQGRPHSCLRARRHTGGACRPAARCVGGTAGSYGGAVDGIWLCYREIGIGLGAVPYIPSRRHSANKSATPLWGFPCRRLDGRCSAEAVLSDRRRGAELQRVRKS